VAGTRFRRETPLTRFSRPKPDWPAVMATPFPFEGL
jgi:hypothetical protein